MQKDENLKPSLVVVNLDCFRCRGAINWCSARILERLMIGWIKKHLEKHRRIQDRCKADARALVSADPIAAYYNAQRLAARCRCSGKANDFLHWSRVAAEVARIEPRAAMDFKTVQAINDREEARQRQDQMRRQQK